MPQPANEAAWARDCAVLADQHRLLLEAIEDFPSALLSRPSGRKHWTWGDLLMGIAMHDAYHAGQIQLLKRLWGNR
jgi:hypothetical protein